MASWDANQTIAYLATINLLFFIGPGAAVGLFWILKYAGQGAFDFYRDRRRILPPSERYIPERRAS